MGTTRISIHGRLCALTLAIFLGYGVSMMAGSWEAVVAKGHVVEATLAYLAWGTAALYAGYIALRGRV